MHRATPVELKKATGTKTYCLLYSIESKNTVVYWITPPNKTLMRTVAKMSGK